MKHVARVRHLRNQSAVKIYKIATALDPNSTYLRDSNGDAYQIFNSITGEKDAQGKLIYTTQNLIINGRVSDPSGLVVFCARLLQYGV